MKKFNQDYFLSHDDDAVPFGTRTINVGFNSNLSQKVLNILHNLGKPYVISEDEVVAAPKAKSKTKKKKVKIDEPKDQPITNTESNEEES